jgi:ornithine cyclodeaminase/alanine dehydrogenase-like protein (mu-crystallin family)
MPLYLTEADVRTVLDRGDPHLGGLVDAFERAFTVYAAGEVITPPSERIRLVYPKGANVRPYDKDMRILPAMLPTMGSAGLRVGCTAEVSSGNGKRGSTSYTLLLDFESMSPLAIIEDHYLHGVRSGTPTGVAVRHLANPGPSVVGVIGAGRISRVQLAVTLGAARASSVLVYSRNAENRERFAREQGERLGVEVTACDSADEVAARSDILLCATNSHNQPVFDGNALRAGCLVASVTPGELDQATALRGLTVLSSSNRVATDYTPQEPIASLIKSGQLSLDALPTIGEVVAGTAAGRRSPEDIVLFFSPGIGFLDLVAARYAYERAAEAGLGTHV